MDQNNGSATLPETPNVEAEAPFKPLERYRSHKIVMAGRIDAVVVGSNGGALLLDGQSRIVDQEFMEKHKPEQGNYYVVYQDGYSSISPAKAFEEGYTLVDVPTARYGVLVEGHRFVAQNFEDKRGGQTIQFIQKEKIEGTNGELRTISDGTTNEALLDILIDRMKYLNGKFPCKENAVATTHLETALLWMEKRTNERKARGVEGKALA